MPALADHGDLQAARRLRQQVAQAMAGEAFANGNLSHMEAWRLRREFRLYDPGHEIDAQDRADDPEWVGDGIADRGILVLHHVERGLQRCSARHRPCVEAERMPDLDAEDVPETQCNGEAGQAGDQRQQVIFLACADHALEELASIENADSVEEHDQAGQSDRADDLSLGCERSEGEADKKNGADAKREAEDVDLADQVADADREEGRQDGLASDDLARKVQHVLSPKCLAVSVRGSPRPGIVR
jgi:hypothetical protein